MPRSKALLNVLNLIDASVGELPVEKQFLNDLKMSIERNDEKGQRKPSPSYKPSSMHCIRNMYFQITGAPIANTGTSSELVGICESGTDRHIRIQDAVAAMKENNIDCEYVNVADYVREHGLTDRLNIVSQQGNETKLYHKTLNMSFLCDGIIRYKGKYYILEIKTESSYKWLDRSYVDDKHRNQAYTYSLELGVDKVLFLYENRDVCTKKPYILTVTKENTDYIENRIETCDDYVRNKLVPPVESDVTPRICQYCDYRTQCKVDGKK